MPHASAALHSLSGPFCVCIAPPGQGSMFSFPLRSLLLSSPCHSALLTLLEGEGRLEACWVPMASGTTRFDVATNINGRLLFSLVCIYTGGTYECFTEIEIGHYIAISFWQGNFDPKSHFNTRKSFQSLLS